MTSRRPSPGPIGVQCGSSCSRTKWQSELHDQLGEIVVREGPVQTEMPW